jgi:hypothetical protein
VSFGEHNLNYTARGRSEQPLVLALTRGIVPRRPLALPQSRIKGECRGSLDQGAPWEEDEDRWPRRWHGGVPPTPQGTG